MKTGVALPATIFALAMTSAMAVGGVYVARRHAASASEESVAASLLPAAERGAIDVLVAWDTVSRAQQPIGMAMPVSQAPTATVWVTRTSEFEYLIVSEASSGPRPTQRHRIGLSVVTTGAVPRLPFPRAWTLLP